MSTELWIYFLLAIIFIVALIFIVVWITIISQPPVFPAAPDYTNSGYGMRCNTDILIDTNEQNQPATFVPNNCALGLVCAAGFCRKDIGTPCNSLFECVPGAVACNGTCSATGKGSLNEICSTDNDCDNIYVCDTSLIIPLCKRPIGSTPCLISNDCISGSICADNICLPISLSGQACLPLENNNSCSDNNVCLNFEDNFYFCQPENITIPGEQDSICYFWNDVSILQPLPPIKNVTVDNVLNTVASCQTGFTCSAVGDFTNIDEYGQCINLNNSAGWFDQCSITNPCQGSQVCLNNNCVFPTITTNNLIEYNPLSCENGESTGFCLENTTCSTVNTKRKCIGNNFNIPGTDLNSCLNGISNTYSVVQQTFADINSDSTNRLSTSSWTNGNFIIPNYINNATINQINFSSFEDINIKIIFHLIGNNFYNITSSNLNTTININNGIHGNINIGPNTYFGKVAKVAYTNTGNYYCIIEYTLIAGIGATNFSNIYISTFPTFNDAVPYCTPYNVKYFIGGNFSFNSQYLYSVSVDDRPISNNLNVRIFFVSGNEASLFDNLYNQKGRLCSITLSGLSLSSISNSLNLFSFDLLSYNFNYTQIDSTIVWCQAFLSRTMDLSQVSKYCYAYSFKASQTRIYGPNPTNINTNVGFTSSFPFLNKTNLSLNSISLYNSRSIDIFNNPCYYIGVQDTNLNYSNQIFLGLSWINQDVVLPADVNLSTLLSVTFTTSVNEINYRPKILLLSHVCN